MFHHLLIIFAFYSVKSQPMTESQNTPYIYNVAYNNMEITENINLHKFEVTVFHRLTCLAKSSRKVDSSVSEMSGYRLEIRNCFPGSSQYIFTVNISTPSLLFIPPILGGNIPAVWSGLLTQIKNYCRRPELLQLALSWSNVHQPVTEGWRKLHNTKIHEVNS